MSLLNIKARRLGLAVGKPVPHWSVSFAKIPYKDKGRDANGADCYGWVRLVYEALQPHITLPAHDVVDPHDGVSVSRAIDAAKSSQLWIPASPESLQALDLVVMRSFYRDKDTSKIRTIDGHIGLMVDGSRLLHMEEDVGVVLGNLKDENIRSRLLNQYYRHRDVKPVA